MPPESAKDGITWIASFPKSGNTWLRFICFYLVHGREPSSSREVDRFANSHLQAENSGRFVKTHAAAFLRSEYFPQTRRAIYVHRHPLDVICSAANYAVLVGEADADPGDPNGMAEWRRRWIDDFIANGAPLRWREQFLTATWSENVASWLFEELPFPVLPLCYADMLDQPRVAVARITSFLELPCDESLIGAAVDATRFERLKAVEEAEVELARQTGVSSGRFTNDRMPALERGYRFFNTGRSGNYRTLLDQDTVEAGEQAFGEVARRLGYTFARPAAAEGPRDIE